MNRRLNVSLKIIALVLSLSVPNIYAVDHGKPVTPLDKHEISKAQSAYSDLATRIDPKTEVTIGDVTLKEADLTTLKDFTRQAGALLSHLDDDRCAKDGSRDDLKKLIDSCVVSSDGDGLSAVFPAGENAAKIDTAKIKGCRYWMVRALEKRTKVEKGFATLATKAFGILLADSTKFETSAHKDSEFFVPVGVLGLDAVSSTDKARANICPLDGKTASGSGTQNLRDRDSDEEKSADQIAAEKADKIKRDEEDAKKLAEVKPKVEVKPGLKTGATDTGGTEKTPATPAPGVGGGTPVPTPQFGGTGSFDPSALAGQNNPDLASLLPALLNRDNNNDRPTVVTSPPAPASPAPPPSLPSSSPPSGNQSPTPPPPGGDNAGGPPPNQPPPFPMQMPQNTQATADPNAAWKQQYAADAQKKEIDSLKSDVAKSTAASDKLVAEQAKQEELNSLRSQMGGPGGGFPPQGQAQQANATANSDTVLGMLQNMGGRTASAFSRAASAVTRTVKRGARAFQGGTGTVNFDNSGSSGLRGAPEGNVR